MNNLYYDDFFEGLRDVFEKTANEHLFTSAPSNASLFPTLNSQAKWRFAKGQDFLRLHDGQKVYAFKLPTGVSHDEDFAAVREADHEPSSFETGATEKGFAQVHRADPGSIYFTLQEGHSNPTFTLKHTGEDNWKGVPKKRKVKETVIPNVDIPAMTDGIKAAFEEQDKKKVKTAGIGTTLDNAFKWSMGPGLDGAKRVAFSPGEFVHKFDSKPLGALALGGIGALGGAGYHYGRRALYNTPEENEAENMEGNKTLLRRMLLPGAALGLMGGAQRSLFPDYYLDQQAGSSPV